MASTLIGQKAPDVSCAAVMGDGKEKDGSYKWLSEGCKDKYVVLFFYPFDFTFVCPTEILAFNSKLADFASRGVEVVACSADSTHVHRAWRNTPVASGGIGAVKLTMLADVRRQVTEAYGVLLNDLGVPSRTLFVLDKHHVVKHICVNDLPLGRSVDEVLRVVDALQFFEKNGEVCPANWHKGSAAMKPTSDGVADYLAKHVKN